MSTKIEWTDKSWNLWHGCSKVSPGCKNCYAEPIAKNRLGTVKKYDGTIKYFLERLDQPLHWKKPRMVFVNSMSDTFHENVPFEYIEKIWDVIFDCSFKGDAFSSPYHNIFQILTKRPERALEFSKWMQKKTRCIDYNNLWLGVSVESPKYLHRIETLLQIPAAVRFVSLEPLLEEIELKDDVNLRLWLGEERIANCEGCKSSPVNGLPYCPGHEAGGIDWIIIGCESGLRRRPCKLEWVYNIVEQCKEAGVPVFVKQLDIGDKVVHDITKFPPELQVREFPI